MGGWERGGWHGRVAGVDSPPGSGTQPPLPGMVKCYREGACRVCRRASWERHHLIPRSQGGADVEENIAPICFDCHRAFHSSPNWREYASAVRATMRLEEVLYVTRAKGEAWLDRRYPMP
jgi:HNH endonuclease